MTGFSTFWIRIPSEEWADDAMPADLPPRGQVDVLSFDLPESEESVSELIPWLTEQERAQAARFKVPKPRRRFIAGRGMMRSTLSAYLGCSPEEVRLTVPESGKPALQQGSGNLDLQFNLSHSGDRIVLALGRDQAVGIDVERLAERRMQQEIAEKHYHPNELALLDAASEGEKPTVFCRCWTLKEAVIKAIGEGLRYPIRTLDFSDVLQGTALSWWAGSRATITMRV